MAIEDVVIDFYQTTTASVSGKTINSYTGGLTAGELDSDLDGYDTGAATGISFELDSSRTVSTNGRSQPDPGDELTREINAEGAYHDGLSGPSSIADFFTVPSTVTSVDVEVYLCTTFTNQDLDVDINGTTAATNFDSSNNTTGATVTATGIAPNGSDQIVITIDDDDTGGPGRYIFVNGYRLYNIVETSAPQQYLPPENQKVYRKSGRFL